MNRYFFVTRLSPVLLLQIPILVIGIPYCSNYEGFVKLLLIIFFLIVLGVILTTIDRDFGKKIEKELWKKWEGCPMIILLNYNNNLLDAQTKDKYHSILLKYLPMSQSIEFKMSTTMERNLIYQWWCMYLVKHIPHDRTNLLLYKETINYGFRRHLWGLKRQSINFTAILLIVNFLFQAIYKTFDLTKLPVNFYISELLLIILLLMWIFFINSDWVKTSALAYTKKLLERSEIL